MPVFGHETFVMMPAPDGIPHRAKGILVIATVDPFAPILLPMFCVAQYLRSTSWSCISQAFGDYVRGNSRIPFHDVVNGLDKSSPPGQREAAKSLRTCPDALAILAGDSPECHYLASRKRGEAFIKSD
jgi:hypothetical protein